MLKISIREAPGEPVTMRLDGQVSARWVKLLRQTCDAHLKRGARVTLDLQNVSFADREGVALLQTMANRGVEILNSLPFIAEQIREETR